MLETYKVEVKEDGTTSWYNESGEYHRSKNLPAIEYANGNKFWYKNGKFHRDDGEPAVIYSNGDKFWYVNDKLHRDSGLPAIEYIDGTKFWWIHGKRVTEQEAASQRDQLELLM